MIRKIQKILTLAERYETNGKKLSEIDTQVLLVEPILCLSGYNLYDPEIVKRASRANKQEFDIEVYKKSKLFLAIEVKSLSSQEFNISKINNSNNIGKLKKNNNEWKNLGGDGVGQLRKYCIERELSGDTIPVLTNGKEWVLFNMKDFINNVEEKVNSNMLLSRAYVTDKEFYENIIEKIT